MAQAERWVFIGDSDKSGWIVLEVGRLFCSLGVGMGPETGCNGRFSTAREFIHLPKRPGKQLRQGVLLFTHEQLLQAPVLLQRQQSFLGIVSCVGSSRPGEL